MEKRVSETSFRQVPFLFTLNGIEYLIFCFCLDATLVYDVQLLQINHSPPPNNNLFKFMDVDSDNQISADEVRICVGIRY